MGISFGSISTGLPKDIVKQIIAAERVPITQMETRKGLINEKKTLVDQVIKLFQELNTDLLANNSARTLRTLKVITNEELIDVAVDPALAETGEYTMTVENLAQKSSAMTSGFADPIDSYVGVGYIRYDLANGESVDIYVDSDHASLKGVAQLINSDKSYGLRANVINDGSGSDTPWRLLLSLDKTGDEFLADFPFFYFVDGEDDFSLEFEREAHDALVTLDGFDIELPENRTSSLIPGLTIDLKKAAPGEEFFIKIIEDREAILGKFRDIVEKLNKVLAFIRDQNAIDANTNTFKTLGGDVTLQTIESKLRNLIFQTFETREGPLRFGDLGISFQKDGLLKLDEERFKSVMATDFNAFSDLLVGYVDEDEEGHNGFINILSDFVKGVLKFPDGMLPLKRQGLQTQIGQIDRQIENRERIIDQKEKSLKDKFARLEGTITKLKTQGAGIQSLGGGNIENLIPDLGAPS